MVTKIKQIFKQAVLRFWSLRVPLIVVCILLAALRCTAQYQDSSRVASAQMTLNYSEASQGLNPNRTRFTTTDLTSDEVLQSTLYNAGLEGQMTVEQLRKAITVEPTDVTNVSSSENYITTSCSISLQLEEPCQHLTAATLLQIFCGSYKDYFMEHYGENQSVFSCTMPDYFDTEPYLRLKSLTLRANQLDRYLTARVSENKSYQDATTGNTFLSLSKQIQNVINYEIPRIQAYILRGGLSADVSSLTAMLQYKLQIEQLDYQAESGAWRNAYLVAAFELRNGTYYNSDNLGIGLYDESMSAIVMIPTLDENSEFYMSRTKTALDTMASDADGALAEATSHQDVITTTQYVVQQMQTMSDPAGLTTVNAMLQELETTMDRIQQALRVTDASYIIYKTQNYLVFNYAAGSFVQQIGLKRVIVEMAAFVVLCFGLCMVRTARQIRKEEQR